MRHAVSLLFLCLLLLGSASASPEQRWQAALSSRDFDAIEQLLERGIDPNLAAPDGVTALMLAARVPRIPLMKALIDKGAQVNAQNDRGGTALMYAVVSAQLDAVELLLEHGANVNAQASNGWTALIIAAAKGYLPIARALLINGADLNTRDVYGWSALMRATHTQRPAMVSFLLEQEGIDVNVRNDNGSTAIHIAAARGERELCAQLLRHGADPTITNRAGNTAIDLARTAGHEALAAYLSGYVRQKATE